MKKKKLEFPTAFTVLFIVLIVAVVLTWRRILMLVIFSRAFPVMVWGVASQGWRFGEMSFERIIYE